nr:immunoglobulin light chain junction region [Macaca mulatta]
DYYCCSYTTRSTWLF